MPWIENSNRSRMPKCPRKKSFFSLTDLPSCRAARQEPGGHIQHIPNRQASETVFPKILILFKCCLFCSIREQKFSSSFKKRNYSCIVREALTQHVTAPSKHAEVKQQNTPSIQELQPRCLAILDHYYNSPYGNPSSTGFHSALKSHYTETLQEKIK